MLNIQNYVKVKSLDEAYELNQKKANRIIGGMMWMRMGDNRINTAIDLSDLSLNEIEETDKEFKIGCMTTLRQLETNEHFKKIKNESKDEKSSKLYNFIVWCGDIYPVADCQGGDHLCI